MPSWFHDLLRTDLLRTVLPRTVPKTAVSRLFECCGQVVTGWEVEIPSDEIRIIYSVIINSTHCSSLYLRKELQIVVYPPKCCFVPHHQADRVRDIAALFRELG